MATPRITIWAISILVAGGLAFGSYTLVTRSQEKECGLCRRPLRRELAVTAEIGGARRRVCCPRCAITEGNQQKKSVRLIQVRDYPTGNALDPAKAFYVDGSRAMACDHDAMMMDESKHGASLTFDRCSPGTFAFARKQDADAFVAQNGGAMLTLEQLMSEVRYK